MRQKPEARLKGLLAGSRFAPLALAESCTGGLISAKVTELPGSSAYFDRGVVVYSNGAKTDLLGVDPELIERCGAVSGEVARAMVEGLLARSPANLAGAVTGVAGPDGGSAAKPVGTVWLAVGVRGGPLRARLRHYDGDRRRVRESAARELLDWLCDTVSEG